MPKLEPNIKRVWRRFECSSYLGVTLEHCWPSSMEAIACVTKHLLSPPPHLLFPFSQSFSKNLKASASLIFDGLATVLYSTMYITLPIWIFKMVKIQSPEKITWKRKKIIRQLRMAIIHPYLCFGKKYCPRELALLITLSTVWGMSEQRFCMHCWWFPRSISKRDQNEFQAFNRTLSLLG